MNNDDLRFLALIGAVLAILVGIAGFVVEPRRRAQPTTFTCQPVGSGAFSCQENARNGR